MQIFLLLKEYSCIENIACISILTYNLLYSLSPMIKAAVAELLAQLSSIEFSPQLLETPQDRRLGDVALPCFTFAKELKKSPVQIAQDIA